MPGEKPRAPGPSERWEHGSDFDFAAPEPRACIPADAPRAADVWTSTGSSYWHSGRDALRGIVAANRASFARVFFPSFYCQDVPIALQADGVEVLCYADAPGAAEDAIRTDGLGLRAGDAIVVCNTLGLRAESPLAAPLPEGVTVVEDHTHDPFSAWAKKSRAQFAFASLRKWLPIPDGARAWSGVGLPVPEAPAFSAEHATVTLLRLSGMLEKARYLAGEAIEKSSFRELLVSGERQIAHGAPGAMSPVARALLDVLPASAYRAARRANFAHAGALLQGIPGVSVLAAPPEGDAVPFTVTLVLATREQRDALRSALAADRIYGAILWPIDASRFAGVPEAHAALSSRLLSLHCDHRYSLLDMERVAAAVRRLSGPAR